MTTEISPVDRQYGSFFGRRKGHKLRAHQTELFATLLPRLALDLAQPAPNNLATVFGQTCSDVRVEIGFGGGENLIAQALAHPTTGFIGAEPYLNGMAKILARIEAEEISNIRLFAGDAADLLRWLPAQSLSAIDLIHPDPWPKRRHWKRRFVQDATIAGMARVIAPYGQFRFASDIADYCAWTLAHFLRAPDFSWTAERADDWRLPWPNHEITRYGKKATREGRATNYLTFKRG